MLKCKDLTLLLTVIEIANFFVRHSKTQKNKQKFSGVKLKRLTEVFQGLINLCTNNQTNHN